MMLLITTVGIAVAACIILSTVIIIVGIRWIKEINKMKKK